MIPDYSHPKQENIPNLEDRSKSVTITLQRFLRSDAVTERCRSAHLFHISRSLQAASSSSSRLLVLLTHGDPRSTSRSLAVDSQRRSLCEPFQHHFESWTPYQADWLVPPFLTLLFFLSNFHFLPPSTNG